MAINETEVYEALKTVKDPELRMGIVDLGMVQSVTTKRNHVGVLVALPATGYAHRQELTQKITSALQNVGIAHSNVEVSVMNDNQRSELVSKLRAASPSPGQQNTAPLGHEEGRPSQFMQSGSRTRILGISSGKGGVGKSSVSVNMAIALAKLGREVAIVDADVYGFSVPKILGISRSPMIIEDFIIPPVAHDVKCISMGFFVEENQPIVWRGPMLHKALEQFLVDVYWGKLDYLILDMPPGTGDVALSMAQYLPRSEIMVVTTPQSAAKRVAQRSAFMAKHINLPIRGVIENMSFFVGDDGKKYEIFGSGGGQELADELEVPLLGQIPLVPQLRQGGDTGIPITVSDPSSTTSVSFDNLAKRIEALGPTRVYRSELSVK